MNVVALWANIHKLAPHGGIPAQPPLSILNSYWDHPHDQHHTEISRDMDSYSRRNDLAAAHFVLGMSIAAATIYVAWRGPWGASSTLLFLTLGLTALVAFGPIAGQTLFRRHGHTPVLILAIFSGVVLISWAIGRAPLLAPAVWALAAGGWAAWGKAIVTSRGARGLAVVCLGIGLLFGLWTALTSYGGLYIGPLLMELVTHGLPPTNDTLFLGSLGNMIRHYGVPSTGLHGTPYVPYHSGVMAVLAWLSNLLNTETLNTLVLAFPMLIMPLCYGAVLRCALMAQHAFREHRAFAAAAAAFLVAACTIGVFPVATNDSVGAWHSDLHSQTYSFGLFLFFTSIEIVLNVGLLRARPPFFGRRWGAPAVFFGGFVLMGAMTYSKGSVGLLALCLLGFVFLRLRALKSILGWALVSGAVTGFVTAGFFLVGSALMPLSLTHFFRTYVTGEWLSFVGIGWPWAILALVVLAYLSRHRPIERLPLAWTAEALLFLIVTSMIPGMLFAIMGGSAFYFHDVSVFAGVAVFAAVAPMTVEHLPSGKEWLRPIPVTWSVIGLLVWVWAAGALVNNLPLYQASVERRRDELTLLASTSVTPIMANFARLSQMPLPPRNQVLIYIPPARKDYWDLASWKGGHAGCDSLPMIEPAYAGFAFLDGRPDSSCEPEAMKKWGYFRYAPREIATRRRTRPDPYAAGAQVTSIATSWRCPSTRTTGRSSTARWRRDSSCRALIHCAV